MQEARSRHLKVDTSELAPGIWEIRIDGSVQFENASILFERRKSGSCTVHVTGSGFEHSRFGAIEKER